MRWLLSAVLLALLAWVLAGLTWLILTPETAISADQEAIEIETPAARAQGDDADESIDLTLLMAINPFAGGGVSGQPTPPQELIDDVKESTLDITYSGCFCPGNGTDGTAFAKVPGSQDTRFVVGDTITSGYTVHSIYSEQLIIERNGELEAVYRREESVITGVERPEAQISGLEPRGTAAEPDDEAETPTRRERANGSSSSDSEDGGNFTIKASDLLANATPSRVRQRGLSVGLTLAPTGDRSVLEQAGLKRNDVILAVNGISFRNINDAEFLEQLTSGGVLRLTVQRGNNPDPITVNLTIEKET